MTRQEAWSSTTRRPEEEPTWKSAMRLQEEQDLSEQEEKYQRELLIAIEKDQLTVQDKHAVVDGSQELVTLQEVDLRSLDSGI